MVLTLALLTSHALAVDVHRAGALELSANLGTQSDPHVKHLMGGVGGVFHASDAVGFGARVMYSPDRGEKDLKALAGVLLDRAAAATSGAAEGTGFQQPVVKNQMTVFPHVAIAPLTGRLDSGPGLDLTLQVGPALVMQKRYLARLDEQGSNADFLKLDPDTPPSKTTIGAGLGAGLRVFPVPALAFGLWGQMFAYSTNKPQFDPTVPPSGNQLQTPFTTLLSGSVFL